MFLSSTRISGKEKSSPSKSGIFVVPTSKVSKRTSMGETTQIVQKSHMKASVIAGLYTSVFDQRERIRELTVSSIKPKVYLIDLVWWKDWCRYTQFSQQASWKDNCTESDDEPLVSQELESESAKISHKPNSEI